MSDAIEPAADAGDSILLLVKDHQKRIEKLEDEGKRTLLKRLTASASASALFLGLILTFASLYDTFVTKPEADRISRITQFNEAVNSAAKIRQEISMQSPILRPDLQLVLSNSAAPQILNDVATAKAILPELRDADIGVPQLIVLIYETLQQAADFQTAKVFIDRAVRLKKNVSPYLQSEAKRYEGQYYFLTKDPVRGRQSFGDALGLLGDSDNMAYPRAVLWGDEAVLEFNFGDCGNGVTELSQFASLLAALPAQSQRPLAALELAQLPQPQQGSRCTAPEAILVSIAQYSPPMPTPTPAPMPIPTPASATHN